MDGKLRSLVADFYWEPGATVSGNVDAFIPVLGIYAGVFSFKDQDKALAEMSSWYRWGNGIGACVVMGSILSWGAVVEHEFGYRSEFAAVRSIDTGVGPIDFDDLQQRYGVTPASTSRNW